MLLHLPTFEFLACIFRVIKIPWSNQFHQLLSSSSLLASGHHSIELRAPHIQLHPSTFGCPISGVGWRGSALHTVLSYAIVEVTDLLLGFPIPSIHPSVCLLVPFHLDYCSSNLLQNQEWWFLQGCFSCLWLFGCIVSLVVPQEC